MLVHKKQEWDYEYNIQSMVPAEKTEQEGTKEIDETIDHSLRSKCLLLVLTIAFFMALITVQSAYIVESGYALVEAKRNVVRLEKENETLRLNIAQLKAHERIAQIASQKLGMISPKNAYFSSTPISYQPNTGLTQPGEDANSFTELLKIDFLNYKSAAPEN